MIYKSYLVEKDKNLLKQSKHYLIYGENLGLIDLFEKTIKRDNIDCEITTFFSKDLIDNKKLLINKILNKSLFTKKKLFIIKEASDKIYQIIDEAISQADAEISIIVISSMLDKKSKIRALFEKDKNLGCIPCYKDNEITLSNYLDRELNGFKNYNYELKTLLIKECNLERKKIDQILDKIKILFNDKIIDRNKINHLIDSNYNDDLELLRDVTISGMKKELNKLLGEIKIDLDNNYYIINLLNIKLLRLKDLIKTKNENLSIKQLIDDAKPPIFWKEKQSYYKLLEIWNIEKLSYALSSTFKAELNIKSSSARKDLIIKNLLVSLCCNASSPSVTT